MIKDNIDKLGSLMTFDKNIFYPDQQYEKDLCDFILALSLIWNDIKTIMLFYEHIRELNREYVKSNGVKSSYSGESSGAIIYLIKNWVSTIWELFSLIRKSEDIINTQVFRNIYKKMNKEYRGDWNSIVDCALNKHTVKTIFAKSLSKIRSKITNHYDVGEISKGYKFKFDNEIPYLSKGNSMAETRFYFADAAAEAYYNFETGKYGAEREFADEINIISNNLNRAIQSLILSFIKLRGHIRPVSEN